jgi:NAD(P)-dependent dehydrogenase (short-subunit alcohol dehydrogenase family)
LDVGGPVDILVNNAGTAAVAAFEEYPSVPEFQKILVRSTFFCASFSPPIFHILVPFHL